MLTTTNIEPNRISDRHTPGINSLVIAVIDQALTDYFILMRFRAIKMRKPLKWPTRKTNKRKEHCGLLPGDQYELIKFLRDGDLDRLIDMAGIDIRPGEIWEGIARLETTGHWKRYYGQGLRLSKDI